MHAAQERRELRRGRQEEQAALAIGPQRARFAADLEALEYLNAMRDLILQGEKPKPAAVAREMGIDVKRAYKIVRRIKNKAMPMFLSMSCLRGSQRD